MDKSPIDGSSNAQFSSTAFFGPNAKLEGGALVFLCFSASELGDRYSVGKFHC
jgi:hypothetical protein